MVDHVMRLYRRLPRAGRWLVLLALGVTIYLGIIEPALDATNALSVRADASARRLDGYVEQARSHERAESSLALAVMRFGRLDLPVASDDRAQRLLEVIDEAVGTQGISDWGQSQGRAVELGRDVMGDVIDADMRVERLQIELKINRATPEQVSGVLATLEASPEITAIGQVQIRRIGDADDRLVEATIVPEAWIVREKGGRS